MRLARGSLTPGESREVKRAGALSMSAGALREVSDQMRTTQRRSARRTQIHTEILIAALALGGWRSPRLGRSAHAQAPSTAVAALTRLGDLYAQVVRDNPK